MMKLETSIQYLKGVGPKMAEKFARLGIETIRDLIFYFPRAWQDFSRPQKISSLRIDQDAIICAKVVSIHQGRTRRKWMSIVEAKLADETGPARDASASVAGGEIKAIWFNQPFLMKVLKPGEEFLFAGKVGWDFSKKEKTLSVTQIENPSETSPKILPIYSETAGLNSKYIRKIIKPVLADIDILISDYLPDGILKEEKLIDLATALKTIHFPSKTIDLDSAKKRLAFDEILLIMLRMLSAKKELAINQAPKINIDINLISEFAKKLPFKLTTAQQKCLKEILADLGRNVPMNRLLEGDVGSGKTVVATMAALVAAKNNLQTVWLAPTEILANQHYQNICLLFKNNAAALKLKIGLYTSANKKADLIKDDLIIGTHALIQKDVHIKNLGLIIIDEQHRFGVKQRAYLREDTSNKIQNKIVPHLLSMTATPIPRSLALTLYGDLDISILDEMPQGRKKVLTRVVEPENRQKAYDFIGAQIRAGRQVFVICPLIEVKDTLKINLFETDRKSAIAEYEKLAKTIFPQFRIGLLHGKMKSKEKEEVMKKFVDGKIDILVSTAVVEVGIDVSNAVVMMIESAERFGLSQLHQFRGRVGRSDKQSFCFLFSDATGEQTQKRLQAMTDCFDGFELAQKDLEMRGPGELSGLRQAGLPDLKMATLTDTIMMQRARNAAEKIISDGLEKYPKLAAKLNEYESARHLE